MAFVLGFFAPASGHGADLTAILAFERPSLPPGSNTLALELWDFYGNPVRVVDIQVEVLLRGTSSRFTTNLAEENLGRYVGRLMLPGSGTIDLRVEAVLPDGPWRGEVKLSTGRTGIVKPAIGLALRHADMPLITPLGAAIAALMSLLVFGSVGMFALDAFRHAKRTS